MGKSKKSGVVLIAIVLILLGVVVDSLVLRNQNEVIFQEEDAELNNLATMLDQNISLAFRYRTMTLLNAHVSTPVKNAERVWLRGGRPEDYLNELQTQLADPDDLTDAVLVIKDGQVVLSTDGNVNYDLSVYVPDGNLLPCVDDEGRTHLLILSEEDSYGVRIAQKLDVNEFFFKTVISQISKDKWVVLLDAGNQLMIYYQNYYVIANGVDAVSGATSTTEGINMIQTIQLSDEINSGSYTYKDPNGADEHVAYMNVIPSTQSTNGYFAVAISGQVDNKIESKNQSIIGYSVGTTVLCLGLLLIAVALRQKSRQSREYEEQVVMLRAKNEEMRRLEEQRSKLAHLERLETMGVLTSGIAHEFNNLLTPIMAYSLMTLEKLPEENSELGDYVEEIYNASKRAKNVIARLSDLSREGSDKVISSVKLEDVIAKALGSASPAKHDNIHIETNLQKDISIEANELQLYQMFLNLFLNAIQAMGDNEGHLLIVGREVPAVEGPREGAAAANGSQAMVEITISDDGPGIPPEIADKIFDPFFTTKDSTKGTGLGLPICRQAAEAHGGSIEVVPSSLGGACFKVTLPKVDHRTI